MDMAWLRMGWTRATTSTTRRQKYVGEVPNQRLEAAHRTDVAYITDRIQEESWVSVQSLLDIVVLTRFI